MRSIHPMARIILIAGLLAVLVLITGLSLPREVSAFQAADPTPSATPTLLPDEQPVNSEDISNMILGAAVILLIIIAGVSIQRILLRKSPEGS